jgi:chromosome segregation ATPase
VRAHRHMDSWFQNIIGGSETTKTTVTIVQEKREYHTRQVNEGSELNSSLEADIKSYKRQIATKETDKQKKMKEVAEIKARMASLPPTGQQATQLKRQAITLLGDIESIEKKIARLNNSIATLENEIEKNSMLEQAEELTDKVSKSSQYQAEKMKKIEAKNIKDTIADARLLNRDISRLDQQLFKFNPIDPEEREEELSKRFEELDFADFEDPITQSPSPQKNANTNDPVPSKIIKGDQYDDF